MRQEEMVKSEDRGSRLKVQEWPQKIFTSLSLFFFRFKAIFTFATIILSSSLCIILYENHQKSLEKEDYM